MSASLLLVVFLGAISSRSKRPSDYCELNFFSYLGLFENESFGIKIIGKEEFVSTNEYLYPKNDVIWEELDGDAYSRNGHPPKKLVLKKSINELQIRSWSRTPCRYGDTCPGRQTGRCWFMHTSSQDEVEVAAGSVLRLRRIQHCRFRSW